MSDRTVNLILGVGVAFCLLYIFVGPVNNAQLDRARQEVRQEISETKSRLDSGFDAAREDVRAFSRPNPDMPEE
jgi:hypothetical protein